MKRPLIATVLAAAIALTPMTATTASAQNNDQLGRILAGAATIAILGYAYKQDKKHERRKERVVTRHAPAPVYRSPKRRHHYESPRFGRHDGYRGRADRTIRVPVSCLRKIRTRNGVQTVIARNCR